MAVRMRERASPQQVAAQKATHAQRMADRALADIKAHGKAITRATERLQQWEAKARRYALRAAMTDEQIATDRQRRAEILQASRASRSRRAITLVAKEGG